MSVSVFLPVLLVITCYKNYVQIFKISLDALVVTSFKRHKVRKVSLLYS